MQKRAERAAEFSHILAILHKWGIRTLGQLAALRRDDLSARLGPEAVRLWEQASGQSTRLLRLVRPPEIFAEQIEFEHEIETVEPVLFVLRRFLEQLTKRLGALYLLARELDLRLTFADPPKEGVGGTNNQGYQHRFQIPDPTNSVELLFRLLRTHLENFRAEHPIVAVALEAQPAPARRQQFRFFETPLRDPARLQETLTRLTGLLGRERVGRPVREDSHQAEAFHLEPFSWEPATSPADLPNEPMIGPAFRRFRFHRPAVSATAVGRRQGPYLSSGAWWDTQPWERIEWDLELEDGVLCRAQERAAGWAMEGIYD